MSDHELQEAFTAAVKAFAARTAESPIAGIGKNAITATEAVIAICELMRAADLNPFDVAMWYRRPLPEFPEAAR
jgi:hypothetical protein